MTWLVINQKVMQALEARSQAKHVFQALPSGAKCQRGSATAEIFANEVVILFTSSPCQWQADVAKVFLRFLYTLFSEVKVRMFV